MKQPDGKTLLQILADLYAEQEGVKISYTVEAAE